MHQDEPDFSGHSVNLQNRNNSEPEKSKHNSRGDELTGRMIELSGQIQETERKYSRIEEAAGAG